MLGYESERRLKNILIALGDAERELEAARQRLCNIHDFAPLSLFERVDRDGNGVLSSGEIIDFLRSNQVFHVSDSEAYSLVQFFDNDGNGKLSYQEFSQVILPCEDNLLRNITLDRPARRIGRYEYLPRDIELCTVAILEKEIDIQRKLEVLKRDLHIQYDYSVSSCFRSLDRYNQREVDTV